MVFVVSVQAMIRRKVRVVGIGRQCVRQAGTRGLGRNFLLDLDARLDSWRTGGDAFPPSWLDILPLVFVTVFPADFGILLRLGRAGIVAVASTLVLVLGTCPADGSFAYVSSAPTLDAHGHASRQTGAARLLATTG